MNAPDDLARDRGLNAVHVRAFAHPDEAEAARAIVGAPFPATTVGLIEAGWALVPILQARSATPLATAAEARLTSILGLLELRRLDSATARARDELDRHRRVAHSAQVPVEGMASLAIGMGVAGIGAGLVWLASLAGAVFGIGVLVATVVVAAGVFVLLRAMTRAELAAGGIGVHGLRIDPWLRDLPPAAAAAAQTFFDLPHGLADLEFVERRDLITVADGAGSAAIVARSRLLWDLARTAPSTADEVRELLTGYLRTEVPGALLLRGSVPRPAWLRGPFDDWERLFDRFGTMGSITARWTVRGGAVIAELAPEYEDEPAAVMVADLVAIASASGAACLTDADTAARAVADLLVNQLVHGDLVMFTRGGGPADRELLVTALQGGDLGEAAVRSQWTGEH